MNILNIKKDTDTDLSGIRELSPEEAEQISGGSNDEEFSHGRGCPCMTCRLGRDVIGVI